MAPDRANSPGQASEFLASAGHELRTPLNAILGMLELALGESLSPSVRQYLSTARHASLGLVESLDELIELAQAHAGSLSLDGVPLSLTDVIAAAVVDCNNANGANEPRVRLRIADEIPQRLRGDPRRLQQMVSHLVKHVVQRSEDQPVLVEVRQQSLSDHHIRLELGISQFGLGNSEDRARFVPFEDVHRSKYSALGLNLPLVECWLKLLHGGLWMAPESDEPAGIYATLELARDGASAELVDTEVPSSSTAPEEPGQPSRPLNILVADDTQANQEVVKAVLAKRGHHVEVANNGRQAVERVQGHDYDVVLMDAQMPLMNGLEAAEAIRRLPNAVGQVPIIALTAHVMPQDRRRCLDAGMDDYLPKPIDAAALVARVEYHGRGGRTSTGAPPISKREETDGWGSVVAGALSRLGGDEELLHELIRLFRLDARSLADKIRSGLASGDHEAVMRAAHNLKGLAANFDAHAVVSLAQQLELAAGQDDLSSASALATTLNVELARLLTLLARYEQDSDNS